MLILPLHKWVNIEKRAKLVARFSDVMMTLYRGHRLIGTISSYPLKIFYGQSDEVKLAQQVNQYPVLLHH